MPRGYCHRHGGGGPCTCAMGNLYRFVEPLVLYLLKKHGRTHGYELVGALQEHALTDSTVEPGALYRTLRRLEENGFVVSTWDTGSAGPARRVYELTGEGEDHLREWIVVLGHMAQSMAGFVADAQAVLSTEHAAAATQEMPLSES